MAIRSKADTNGDSAARRLRTSLLKRARSAENHPGLPDLAELRDLLVEAVQALAGLNPEIRPRNSSGRPGGLLRIPDGVPTLIVPDLHTRGGLLSRVLEWTPPEEELPLAELAADSRAALLFLGDLFHSEGPEAPARWEAAYREYLGGFRLHEAMDDEMGRGLSALDVLVRMILLAPERVWCLKGNHDNSRNREGGGDHGFYKFADEGAMCAEWLEVFAEEDFRTALASFEESLPLAAVGEIFVASHAEPAFPLTSQEIIEGDPETVEALIWTANGQALPYAVSESLASLLGPEAPENGGRWISGHRPVDGRYALRAEGLLVQIHAPSLFQGAWMRPGIPFDPETDLAEL